MDPESEFVRAFVLPAKRARLVELLQNPKRRAKVLASLDHFCDLDPRFQVEIPSSEQSAERGAPSVCHLISSDRGLDGRDFPLLEALVHVMGSGMGTLVSCVPGRLGYFEGEAPRDRFLLARDRAPRPRHRQRE